MGRMFGLWRNDCGNACKTEDKIMYAWILEIYKRDSTRRLILASRYDEIGQALIAGIEWHGKGYDYKITPMAIEEKEAVK